jgi:hypothetical protein
MSASCAPVVPGRGPPGGCEILAATANDPFHGTNASPPRRSVAASTGRRGDGAPGAIVPGMGAGGRGAFPSEHASAGAALVIATLALGAGGCFFGELDYEGKTCSGEGCAPGWTCAGTASIRNESACAFQPQGVRIAWTTPHTIRWEWDPPENLGGFGSYRLRVGQGAGPESGGEVREITGDENPELRWARIPRAEADDRIRGTISVGHESETQYWGQLLAIDNEGCTWSSPTLTATTQLEPPLDQEALVVFRDVPMGWVLPDDVDEDPPAELSFDGSPYLSWTAGDDSSGENVKLGVHLPLTELGNAVQDTAFIQAAVALDQSNHSYWTRVGLARGEGNDDLHSNFEPFTLSADGTYHIVEIPIRAMGPKDGIPLSSEHTVYSFKFGCSPFEPGAVVRIDEVLIRW